MKSIEDMTLPEIDAMLFAIKSDVLKRIPESATFAIVVCTEGDKVSPVFLSMIGDQTKPLLEHVLKCIDEGKYTMTREKSDEDR